MEVIKVKPAQSEVEKKEKSLVKIVLIDFLRGVSSCRQTHQRPSDLLQHEPGPEVGPT